jgi:hypothetical protein
MEPIAALVILAVTVGLAWRERRRSLVEREEAFRRALESKPPRRLVSVKGGDA